MKIFKKIAAMAALSISAFALSAVPAHAVDPQILMFSNGSVTDPAEEDIDMADALDQLGDVTLFDGGSGSLADWQEAIAGKDAIVFPEGDVFHSDFMSPAAANYVKQWIYQGGVAVGTGGYDHQGFIDFLTNVDRSDVWSNNDGGPWLLSVDDNTLPSSLPSGDWTGGISDFDTWSDAQLHNVVPVYLNAAETNAGVATFLVGSGSFTYFAFDWYPENDDTLVFGPWEEALRFAASGEIAAAAGAGTNTDGFVLDLTLNLEVGDTIVDAPVDISANGLKPGSEWDIVLRSTPITLDTGVVGNGGNVFATVTIPDGLEEGWHTLTLTGVGSDGKTYVRVVHFEIDANGLLASEVLVDPVTEGLASTGVDAMPMGLGAAALIVAGGIALAVRRRKA